VTRSAARGFAADSWAFLLRIYAEPGVADACLRLQAAAHVDVTLLLVVAFASVERSIALAPADIGEIDALCRPWREQIVRPLRALRTTLKSGPAPAPHATDDLRKQIKASELAAERLQNDLLADWFAQHAAVDMPPGIDAVSRALREVVAASATPGEDLAEADATALETIAMAARRVSR
jgi:uncharacterized protein (TIGR02444 family)